MEYILSITHTFNNKNLMKGITNAVLAWGFGLFIPVLPYLQGVFTITVADFLIGVTAALLASESFSWKKASLLAAKLLVFGLLIVSTYQIQLLLQLPPITIGSFELNTSILVAGVICVAELKSILRNVKSAFGIDIWGLLTDKVPFLKSLDSEKRNGDTHNDNNSQNGN
jgi:hypothetical protein